MIWSCTGHSAPSCRGESKYFKEMMEAVASYGAGYQPPTDEQLSSSSHLLVEAVDKVDKERAYLTATISRYGSTITCNGWSNTRMCPLLEHAAGLCRRRQIRGLHRCFSGREGVHAMPVLNRRDLCPESQGCYNLQDATYIADRIGAAVEAAGEDNVDLVVTDVGSGTKQAGAILEERCVPAK